MKISQFNESIYFNAKIAEEYNGQILTIFEVSQDTVRGQPKVLIGFEGVEKMLIANKTVRDTLALAFGDDTLMWHGRRVKLTIGKVIFNHKLVPSIGLTPIVNGDDAARVQQEQEANPIINGDDGKPLGKGKRK